MERDGGWETEVDDKRGRYDGRGGRFGDRVGDVRESSVSRAVLDELELFSPGGLCIGVEHPHW
jgi:hypothetical protein